MSLAICIKCGEGRKRPIAKCNSCGFKPTNEEDLVKSMWLSTDRRFTAQDLIDEAGPTEEKLISFQNLIKSEESIPYSADELQILRTQYIETGEVSLLRIYMFCMCFLVLPIVGVILAIINW